MTDSLAREDVDLAKATDSLARRSVRVERGIKAAIERLANLIAWMKPSHVITISLGALRVGRNMRHL